MKKTGFFEFGKKTYVMGILNVTPDSFFDGGKYFSLYDAVNHALRMQNEGADIIDIGGQSTRPGAKEISVEEEKKRVIPVIEKLIRKIKIPISIDTYRSEIAKEALKLGAKMVNDVTALRGDKNLARVVAHYNVPVCLMHMKGEPKNMQENPSYKDVVKEISIFLKERADFAISCGIKKDKIIIDPGLGFGKRTGKGIEDNCEILRRLSEFKNLGYPIMIGPSRKTFIGNVCRKDAQLPVNERLEGSLAAACVAVLNGADIVRVHDVKETRRCMDLIDSIIRKN
ncbi:MAG: dihydropteroate synthase [Thermoplasmatota archaeon]|jgi:dihydropteroate synthase